MAKKKDNARKKNAAKKTEAQKKAAESLKKPAKPKTEPKRDITLRGEQTTPTASPDFSLPTEVPPQIREEYKTRFEEAQTAEIGKITDKYATDIQNLPTPADPEEIKKVRGRTGVAKGERDLTPKPTPLEEPGTGSQIRRQSSRRPKGGAAGPTTTGSRAGAFKFDVATPPGNPLGVKTLLDLARGEEKGRDRSPLNAAQIDRVVWLARRDHTLARQTGKMVADIHPDDPVPTADNVRYGHHERLVEAMDAYGAKEEDFNKLPGQNFVDKVHSAWEAHKSDERANDYRTIDVAKEGITHVIDPTDPAGGAVPINEQMGEFKQARGPQMMLTKLKGTGTWRITPAEHRTIHGWETTTSQDINGNPVKALKYEPPIQQRKEYAGHEFRSLKDHILSTLRSTTPPNVEESSSVASRKRAAAAVQNKFIDVAPQPEEASMFSRTYKQEGPIGEGTPSRYTIKKQRGKTAKKEIDNVIKDVPEQETLLFPKPKSPFKGKRIKNEEGKELPIPYVMEPGTTRPTVRPLRKTEDNTRGVVTQPLTVPTKFGRGQQFSGLPSPADVAASAEVTKIGPNGEILKSKPTIEKGVKLVATKKQRSPRTRTDLEVVPTYKVTPGQVDQMLPGMEDYGYEEPAKKASRYWRGTLGTTTVGSDEQGKPITMNLKPEEAFKGKWVETPATPGKPGSSKKPFTGRSLEEVIKEGKTWEGNNFLGFDTGGPSINVSNLEITPGKPESGKKRRGGRIPMPMFKGTALEGVDKASYGPMQLELPGIESPGYAGAVGQQFRSLRPAEAALENIKEQGSVEGSPISQTRGVSSSKKSTRSFKGRR